MISHRYRCVIVHLPKAAGQSIERFFLRLHGLTWENHAPLLLRRNEDPARGPRRLAHLFADEYIACGHIGEAEFSQYFKFASVRNPWDRLASEYRYLGGRRLGGFRKFEIEGAQSMDPHEDSFRRLAPRVRYLRDRAGRLSVDFVGRFESLHNDFARVCAHLGIPDATLPHANTSDIAHAPDSSLQRLFARFERRRETHVDCYDAALRELVAERYAEDIEAFGHAFGEPA